MVSGIVAGTAQEFIKYAEVVVAIMIIWYVIKFFMVAPPTKEERARKKDETQSYREEIAGAIKDKMKKSSEERAAKKRIEGYKPAEGFLIRGLNNAEDAMTYLRSGTEKDAGKARNKIKSFARNVYSAWRELKYKRDEARGDDRTKLENLAALTQNVVNIIKEKKITDLDVAELLANSEDVINFLERSKNECLPIIQGLEEFTE